MDDYKQEEHAARQVRGDPFPSTNAPGFHFCPNCHGHCYCAEKDDGYPCSHQETHNCKR